MGKLTIATLAFLFAACFMGPTNASFAIPDGLVTKMRNQIQLEMKASLFYQTYAHFFEHSNQALHGFAKFFYEQSIEEKSHADKLMTYLNKRNVEVKTLFKVNDICSDMDEGKNKDLCKFITGKGGVDFKNTLNIQESTLTAIDTAIELEKKVYNELEGIAKGSDAQLSHFIEHEFLDEQIDSIKDLMDLQTQKKNVGTEYVGLLLMDRWLLDKKKTEL